MGRSGRVWCPRAYCALCMLSLGSPIVDHATPKAQTETQLRRLLSHFFTTYDPEVGCIRTAACCVTRMRFFVFIYFPKRNVIQRLQREPVGNDTAAWFFDNLSSLNSRLLQEYDTDLFGFTAVQSFLYALGYVAWSRRAHVSDDALAMAVTVLALYVSSSTQRSRFTDSALKKLQPQSHLVRLHDLQVQERAPCRAIIH